jgi:hypothetical protein
VKHRYLTGFSGNAVLSPPWRTHPKFSVLSLCPESRPLTRKLIDQQEKRVRMAPIFASLRMLWGTFSALLAYALRKACGAPVEAILRA